jgi:hypothetical protein
MLSLNRTALVCALLLVVAGCSQKTSSATRDAGRDVVVTPHDSGEDVASPHDAGRDVAQPHDSGRDVASPRDAGRDVVLPHDAGRDVALPRDAGRVDATHDAAPRDAAIVCAYPIGPSQCTSDAATACRRTWAQVLATPPSCGPFVYEYESRGTCGAYDEAEFVGLTQKGMYYYDATTGQLAAVYTVTGTMTPSCYEGPPGGIPTCDLPAADNKCLRDAGTGGRG